MTSPVLALTPAGGKTLRVLSATIVFRWRGAWWMDLDLDPDAVSDAPTSGKATFTLTPSSPTAQPVTMQGTVDPRYSGSFVAGAKARLVAGAGGWDKPVTAQDFGSASGVNNAAVFQATAAAVGETVNVVAPAVVGAHLVRTSSGPGPASRVFGDLDWYVDFVGVTQVASRPAATADASLQLLSYEPSEGRAELACDTLVLPGTTLSDPRLNGQTPTIRDVEITFDKDGMRTTAWCSSAPVSPLAAVVKALVREYAGVSYLKIYAYRYVQTSAGGLALQAIDTTAGAPDLNPVIERSGMAALLAKLAPSTTVYVGFVAGRPNDPLVVAYDGPPPGELTLDAAPGVGGPGLVHVGPSATKVDLAGGATPLVLAPWATGAQTALATFAAALATATTLADVIAAGSTLEGALAALPAPATTKATAI